MERTKPQFDFLNFVYGVGAAVVILGAIAKFLDWKYADEIFITGLATEVLVFIVSAFRFKKKKSEYQWEKVFPGILEGSDDEFKTYDQVGVNNEIVKKNTVYLENKLTQMEDNIDKLNDIFVQLAKSVEGMNSSIKKLEDANNGYEGQMNELKKNLGTMNDFYTDFNDVMVRKNRQDKDK